MSGDRDRMVQLIKGGVSEVLKALKAYPYPLRYNFHTHRLGFAEPGERLAQIGPGLYTLSTLSTVPYVQIVAGQGKEKLLSWGEMVHVVEGFQVSVQNASFHGGDLVLNSGADYAAHPQRLTVPVAVVETGSLQVPTERTGSTRVDTRRAVRAYLLLDATTGSTGATITITGEAMVRTHFPPAAAPAGVTNTYTTTVSVPPNTEVPPIPLGFRAELGDTEPHALLDRASFTLDEQQFSSISEQAYYVLEYG